MARKFGPFDSPPTQFYEVENRRMQRAFNDATGFVKTGQGVVTAGTGAQLVIAPYPDGALIDGLYVENPASETVTLTTNAGSTNPRIDRLVMRLDMTAKKIEPFQIQGTPAASPTIPPLVKTDTVVDMPLCRYTMPGSASAQNPGSIVDERQYVNPWDGIDKTTQPMISLNAVNATLGVTASLFTIAGWTNAVDHGQGLLTRNGSAIQCNAAGRVRVEAHAFSDHGAAGYSWLSVTCPVGGGSLLQVLDDQRQRSTGYGGAGALRQTVSDGPIAVLPGDQFAYRLAQENTAGSPVTYQCYMTVTYV